MDRTRIRHGPHGHKGDTYLASIAFPLFNLSPFTLDSPYTLYASSFVLSTMSNETTLNTHVITAEASDASATIPTLRVVTELDAESSKDPIIEGEADGEDNAAPKRAESYDSTPPESEVSTPTHPQIT